MKVTPLMAIPEASGTTEADGVLITPNTDKLNFAQIEKELWEIFSHYHASASNAEQKKVISKGFVYSEVDFSADVLICGFNPSERTDFLKSPLSYEYSLLCNDRYFKKFIPFFKAMNNQLSVSYFDLFYQKHSKQQKIQAFKNDKTGKNFLQDQLNLTKKLITLTKPKAIFIFNKQAFDFFTFNEKYEVGLLLDLDKMSLPNTYKVCSGPLKNTLIYSSRFLNHFVSQKQLNNIHAEVQTILNVLV